MCIICLWHHSHHSVALLKKSFLALLEKSGLFSATIVGRCSTKLSVQPKSCISARDSHTPSKSVCLRLDWNENKEVGGIGLDQPHRRPFRLAVLRILVKVRVSFVLHRSG